MTTKKPTHLLALDQGTSSSRSIVFDAQGGIVEDDGARDRKSTV